MVDSTNRDWVHVFVKTLILFIWINGLEMPSIWMISHIVSLSTFICRALMAGSLWNLSSFGALGPTRIWARFFRRCSVIDTPIYQSSPNFKYTALMIFLWLFMFPLSNTFSVTRVVFASGIRQPKCHALSPTRRPTYLMLFYTSF